MQLLLVSRLAVLVFALFSGVWSIALIHIGIDINWLFFVIGLLVASVFPPISFLLTWNAVPKVCDTHLTLLQRSSSIKESIPLVRDTPTLMLEKLVDSCSL